MSVGDVKGSRRRFKVAQQQGHAPRAKGRSVSESVARERALAQRLAKVAMGKKK